jgi:isocitrate dehydrogenase (NAD+)
LSNPTDSLICDQTIAEGKTITGDLGGKASTAEYTKAIIEKLVKA